MKKTLIAVALIAPMLLLSACGNATESGKGTDDGTKITEEVPKDTGSDSVGNTEEEITEEVTTENEKSTEEMNGAPNSDVVSIAGDWFVDGDMAQSFIHISPDATFKAYYPSGILECEGTIRYEEEEIEGTVVHWYHLYDQNGEHYMGFVDDGSSVKTDLYVGNGAEPHYVKIGAGGILDDGRGPGEEFVGNWGCGRASLTIEQVSDTEFHASIMWSDSAASHAEWDYPLTYQDGKLVCDGKCTKSYVEFTDPGTDPEVTVEYTDGSAEFERQGIGIVWKDLTEQSADGMLFLDIES